jgi:hypothetical protein
MIAMLGAGNEKPPRKKKRKKKITILSCWGGSSQWGLKPPKPPLWIRACHSYKVMRHLKDIISATTHLTLQVQLNTFGA